MTTWIHLDSNQSARETAGGTHQAVQGLIAQRSKAASFRSLHAWLSPTQHQVPLQL